MGSISVNKKWIFAGVAVVAGLVVYNNIVKPQIAKAKVSKYNACLKSEQDASDAYMTKNPNATFEDRVRDLGESKCVNPNIAKNSGGLAS